jgi:prevent-host-death family protein
MDRSPEWSAADARTKLPALIEAAEREGPQRIMRYGKLSAVLLSARDWEAVREAAKNALAEESEDVVDFPRLGRIGVKAADLSDRRR